MAITPAPTALKPENFPLLMSGMTDRQKETFTTLLETYATGLVEGKIANPVYQDAKQFFGRRVDEGYKHVIRTPLIYPAIRDRTLPEAVRDLESSFMIMSLHDCKSALKKVRAAKLNHPVHDAMKSYLEEVEPLVLANEALKTLVVKRMPKTDEQKEAEKVFVPPKGSTEATTRVQQMLIEVTTSERENIVKWLRMRYERMAAYYFAGTDNEPATVKSQSKLYSDPEYREVVIACTGDTPWRPHQLQVRSENTGKPLDQMAEKHAKFMQDQFVFKNLKKLAAIIEAKKDFDRGEVLGHSVNLAGLSGAMRFHFKDGAHFKVENSVVYSTSVHGTHFMRFPLTFHEVYFGNGERMKSPSEERMHEVFVKGPPTKGNGPALPTIDLVCHWEGEQGNTSHLTAKELLTIPPGWLDGIEGQKGEVRDWTPTGGFGNYSADGWAQFLADIKKNGIQNPITVFADPDRHVRVHEGNHRIAAAKQLGLSLVPAEIRYFGHAEQEQGMFADRIERETGQLRAVALAALSAVSAHRKDVAASTWSRVDDYPVSKLGDSAEMANLLIEARAKAEEEGTYDQLQALLDDPLGAPVVVLERDGCATLLSDKLRVAAAMEAGIAKVSVLVGAPLPAAVNDINQSTRAARSDYTPSI